MQHTMLTACCTEQTHSCTTRGMLPEHYSKADCCKMLTSIGAVLGASCPRPLEPTGHLWRLRLQLQLLVPSAAPQALMRATVDRRGMSAGCPAPGASPMAASQKLNPQLLLQRPQLSSNTPKAATTACTLMAPPRRGLSRQLAAYMLLHWPAPPLLAPIMLQAQHTLVQGVQCIVEAVLQQVNGQGISPFAPPS